MKPPRGKLSGDPRVIQIVSAQVRTLDSPLGKVWLRTIENVRERIIFSLAGLKRTRNWAFSTETLICFAPNTYILHFLDLSAAIDEPGKNGVDEKLELVDSQFQFLDIETPCE